MRTLTVENVMELLADLATLKMDCGECNDAKVILESRKRIKQAMEEPEEVEPFEEDDHK